MTGVIYKIINKKNKKYYVGSSKDVHKRMIEHRYDLSKGIHRNKKLQEEYNAFGEENFKYEIIETYEGISRDDLDTIKQGYLDRICDKTSYNMATDARGGGSNVLKVPCYLLDLNGNIVTEFESRSDAVRFLGRAENSSLTFSRKRPESVIKSKKNNNRYRIINKDYYKRNKEEIMNYDRGRYGKYFYDGGLRTVDYMAEKEGITPKTVMSRIRQGRFNEEKGEFDTRKAKKYYFEGEMLTVDDIAEILEVTSQTVRNRIKSADKEYNAFPVKEEVFRRPKDIPGIFLGDVIAELAK